MTRRPRRDPAEPIQARDTLSREAGCLSSPPAPAAIGDGAGRAEPRRKSRVVIFNNMISPYGNRLYNHLRETGLDVAVLSCSEQEPNRSWARTFEPHYPHEILTGFAIRLSQARYAHVNSGIMAALDRMAPDLLVITGFYPSMAVGAVWAKRRGVPLALSIDGWRRTMPMTPYHRLLRPWILKQCEAIAVCSQKGLSYFRDEGFPESNLYLVPLIPAWEPPLLVPSFSERPYHLLWAAQMNDSVKNVSFFVEVAIALKRRLPELKIHVVGRGPSERKTLARLRAAEIDHRHDRDIAWHEMPEVYASARVLVLPSLWEAWGMVCNEALQCGVPSVVSPFVGAADDVVLAGRNGEVCRLDVGEWVRKLERLVLDPEVWTSYSTNARADMRTRTLADVAASFRAMVDQVLGRAEKRRDRVKMHPPGSGEGPRIAAASCLALRIWVDEVVVSAAASECACAIF